MPRLRALALAAILAAPRLAHGQAVGSEAEHLAAALALLPDSARPAWAATAAAPPRLSVGLRSTLNSGFPSAQADGPVWAGRGLTLALDGALEGRWGPLEYRVAPVLWGTQNGTVSLIPTTLASPPNPYVDPMRPRGIDLPQRFGDGSVARLDPGNTELAIRQWRLRGAFTAAARRLGAGQHHAIVMSPDAPGFPRVELGSDAYWRTPLGDVAVTLGAGQIGQTRWAPQRREGSRSGSFFEGRWRPFRNDRLELGGVRFYHQDWDGVNPGALVIPFGSLFFDAQNFGGGAADNQMLSVFGKLRFPEQGLELWAEYGVNDRQTDLRELIVELEHNAAFLFGIRRAWRSAGDALWVLDATAGSGRIPSIAEFRNQATFYEHNPISQGHTNRGQLLGTRLLERTGGVELRLDRYGPTGRVGVIIASRDLQQQRTLVVAEERLRREWSVMGEWLRAGRGGWEYFARAGFIADLNRHPTFGDAYSAVLATGLSYRR